MKGWWQHRPRGQPEVAGSPQILRDTRGTKQTLTDRVTQDDSLRKMGRDSCGHTKRQTQEHRWYRLGMVDISINHLLRHASVSGTCQAQSPDLKLAPRIPEERGALWRLCGNREKKIKIEASRNVGWYKADVSLITCWTFAIVLFVPHNFKKVVSILFYRWKHWGSESRVPANNLIRSD